MAFFFRNYINEAFYLIKNTRILEMKCFTPKFTKKRNLSHHLHTLMPYEVIQEVWHKRKQHFIDQTMAHFSWHHLTALLLLTAQFHPWHSTFSLRGCFQLKTHIFECVLSVRLWNFWKRVLKCTFLKRCLYRLCETLLKFWFVFACTSVLSVTWHI